MTASDGPSRRAMLRGGATAFLAALAGCASGGDSGGHPAGTTPAAGAGRTPAATASVTATAPTPTPTANPDGGWRTTELTDVRTDEAFTVGGFEGRPVLLEFFAVWCPICTRQQRQIGALLDDVDDLVAISLDIDPNEDAARVREHLQRHGFDWRYAVAPTSMTKALVDEFGPAITSPPAAPVVRICPDGSAALLDGRGVKSRRQLRGAFDGC